MNDIDIYLLFSEQFRSIDDNLDDLVRRSETFAEANQITNNWKQANLNYLLARNKIFSSQADAIKDLVKDFKEAQESIDKSLAALKQDATTISIVSKVITFGVAKGKELQESV